MQTRRDFLLGTIGAGAVLGTRTLFARAAQPATAVNFEVPAGACDSHTHIFGDPAKFPLSPRRGYTPEPALPEEMSALHRSLHMQRVVIVTPSVYGTDNSASLFGIKARGGDARGIAVIEDNTTDAELDALARGGFRGIRLNLAQAGTNDPNVARTRLTAAAEKMKRHGWHIQINTNLAVIARIKDAVLASPVPIVFDHFGGAQATLGVQQPGFGELIDLVRSGRAYVKISAAYRSSDKSPDFPDIAPLARALIGANADRILWGTDWPHPHAMPMPGLTATDLSPLLQIDDGRLLNQLPVWAPDPATRKKILVDNPARLYEF